jgi:flagellar biosynthesis/type III secretory pathway protein FliH
MLYPETKARYAEWKAKVLDEGRKEGIEKGRKEGERALVRKLLTLRFGELPADAEQRLEQASLAELERWAERVLTARNLAAVLAD